MTISSTTAKNQYTATGVLTVFAYQFKVFDEDDLDVYLDDVLQSSGYLVSDVGEDDGGNVTFSVAPSNGTIVTLLRNQPQVQETELPAQGPFPSEAVENQLDKLVMMILALDERVQRTLLLSIASTLTGLSLPTPEAGKALGWNSGEDGFTNLEPSSGALLSTFMATVGAAADADAAQTALGGTDIGREVFTAPSLILARQAIGAHANARTSAKTSSYAFTALDVGRLIPLDGSLNPFTQTLTAAATLGTSFVIGFQKVNSSYNAITLDGNGSETINGVTDFVLTNQYETIWLMCDGVNWSIIDYTPGNQFQDGVIIEQQTASASATIDFTKGWNTTAKFRRMVFEWDGLYGATADAGLVARLSTDGSTFLATNYEEAGISGTSSSAPTGYANTGQTAMNITGSINNAVAEASFGCLEISNYHTTTQRKISEFASQSWTSTTAATFRRGTCGRSGTTGALLGLRFLMSSGNITAGTITQKGYR